MRVPAVGAVLMLVCAAPALARPAGPPDDGAGSSRGQSLAPVPMLGWPWLEGKSWRMRVPPQAKIRPEATLVRRTDGIDAAVVDVGSAMRLDVKDGTSEKGIDGVEIVNRRDELTVDGSAVELTEGRFIEVASRFRFFVQVTSGNLRITAFCADAAATAKAERMFGTLSLDWIEGRYPASLAPGTGVESL